MLARQGQWSQMNAARARVVSRSMRPSVSKDTTLCISLSSRPSNVGTRFHNYLYEELGLDFVYKAFTTRDLPGAVAGIRALGIRGCGVSMPFKEACIPLLDSVEPSAAAIDSVNTIVNDDGVLRGYNTDYVAVSQLIAAMELPVDLPFVLLGSGGMAKAVAAAMRQLGFTEGSVVARNATTGTALADRYGFRWHAELGDLRPAIIVNATPIGMAGDPRADDLPVEEAAVDAACAIVEVVAVPAETRLVRRARSNGSALVTGVEIIGLQAAEQFVLYTGVRPTDDQVQRASEHARTTP
jgi:shikimate dehydrogenase